MTWCRVANRITSAAPLYPLAVGPDDARAHDRVHVVASDHGRDMATVAEQHSAVVQASLEDDEVVAIDVVHEAMLVVDAP